GSSVQRRWGCHLWGGLSRSVRVLTMRPRSAILAGPKLGEGHLTLAMWRMSDGSEQRRDGPGRHGGTSVARWPRNRHGRRARQQEPLGRHGLGGPPLEW